MPPSIEMVMLASAATASARAGPARTAPTGYRSSLRASSSALIAEISASTASACSPRCRQRRTTPARAAGHVPGPAAAGRARGEVGIRAVRLAALAPAARPAAPAPLLGQRPGQHLLHVAEPGRRRAAAGQQLAGRQALKIVLVCIHHTREMPRTGLPVNDHEANGQACRARPGPRPTAGVLAAAHPGRSRTAAA